MSEAKAIRIMPLPVVHPRWDTDLSAYPETIQVSFSNGKVRTYVMMADKHKPSHLLKTSEMSRLFRENTHGYQPPKPYKPKHAKK